MGAHQTDVLAGDAAELWDAPLAHGPLDAVVEVPGSKSQTNRLLVLAALADRPSVIKGALRARDTELMVAGLRAFGTAFDTRGWDGADAVIEVRPAELPVDETRTVDVGLAGTVMRFLPPVAALAGGATVFDGDDGARVRPMCGLVSALRELGAEVNATTLPHGELGLPLTVRAGHAVARGAAMVDASASSQFVSALLLAAPRFAHGLRLTAVGSVPSRPHIEMTVAALRERGVEVEEPTPNQWVVRPGPIRGGEMLIEPDLSNAAAFLAVALVAGGQVAVPRWPTTTTQPGRLVPGILHRMGGSAQLGSDQLSVTGTGQVKGIDIDLSVAGELAPTIAALAALADSPTRITGVAHLRGHETDRLAALVSEINGLGGDARELPDGIAINPAPLHGGVWRTYHDHRMATAGALIGLRVPEVQVENIATTGKTLPGFAALWQRLVGGECAKSGVEAGVA